MARYPNDADGAALRNLARDGNDMKARMLIEFPVVMPTQEAARKFAAAARGHGFDVEVSNRSVGRGWDVVFKMNMFASHAKVVRIQRALTQWAGPIGGYCDGWGTLGNKTGKKKKARVDSKLHP